MATSASRLADRNTARDWLVAALGGALTAAAVGHFVLEQHSDPMVVAATVGPAVAVLGYGVWFWLLGPQVARGDAVFVWAVGGAGVVLALDLWAIAVNAYGTGAAIDNVFIQHTSIGALGAALAGTYSERDRQQSRAHDRLRRALDTAMDGVAVLDDERRVAYANVAFCENVGACEPDDVVGSPWTAFYPAETHARLGDVFDAFDDDSRDHWHGKVLARREDGQTYPQELSVTPLASEGYVCVFRDVTSREERDQRLRVLNRVLRHNVRNSLNVVLGRAGRLADHLDDAHDDREAGDASTGPVATDTETAVTAPRADVESIVTAAEDLLAVSEKARVVERVLGEDDAPTASLSDLVAAEAESLRSEYPEATADETTETDAEVDARLRLAVRELLVNAVEHNDADTPQVRVAALDATDGTDPDGVEGAEGRPVVRVSDNGPGIPPQERRALEGVDEAPLEHGSGIGLWAVYWLAQQCGATVVAEDETTVAIYMSATD